MTEGAAIEIIKCQMLELGVGENYILRYRHLKLAPSEKRILKGENNLYVIIDFPTRLKVESKAGIFDMADKQINEQQHIHRGVITVLNQIADYTDAKFIQVIPKLKNNQKI